MMKQTEHKNQGTIIVPITIADITASGKVIAKLPRGARIKTVNVTIDEVFNGTINTITLGVAGTTAKFHSALSLASLAGTDSTRQHTSTDAIPEILMTIAAAGATTGIGNITIDYALPTQFSVEY
jgi:hypothetical protein